MEQYTKEDLRNLYIELKSIIFKYDVDTVSKMSIQIKNLECEDIQKALLVNKEFINKLSKANVNTSQLESIINTLIDQTSKEFNELLESMD